MDLSTAHHYNQMKASWAALSLLFTFVVFAYPIEDLICPDSIPENCYPKIFKPTKEWQTVKEGQEIPGGLHIRVNIETQSKEAKLLDPEEMPPSNDLQIIESDPAEGEQAQQPEQLSHKPNAKISVEDKGEFGNSIHTLQSFIQSSAKIPFKKIHEAFTSLEELAHDLDFGIRIADVDHLPLLLELADLTPSTNLQKLKISQADLATIKERSLIVIAAALRNNPIAVQNALKPEQKPSFVINRLLDSLATTNDNVIQKRILGVITGFIQDGNGSHLFNLNDGQNKILLAFNKLSQDGKVRALQILDDLNDHKVLKRSDDGSEEELTPAGVDLKYFNLLQDKLVADPNHHDFKKLFIALVDYKETKKSQFKVDSNFLNWLVNEIERRKTDEALEKRDNQDNTHGDEESFVEYMARVRHTVFGNPMGHRKALADEL